MRRRLLILFSLAFQYAESQTVGKYAGEFLAIGVGGRALGLGGAYTALAIPMASTDSAAPAASFFINISIIPLVPQAHIGFAWRPIACLGP